MHLETSPLRERAIAPRRVTRLAAALLAATPALAQGADECANAVDLGSGSVVAPFDTAVCSDTGLPATTSAQQQCLDLSADVWFRWTATRTGPARFDLCDANYDCEVGLWEGTSCATMTPRGCVDDACGVQPVMLLAAQAGRTYYVQIGFWTTLGLTGSGNLRITELSPPPNNYCSTAAVLPAGVTSVPFDTGGAIASGFAGAGGTCPSNLGPDIFYQWTASAAGAYDFRTCGSSFDTRLSVFSGIGCGAVCRGTNDDACGLGSRVQVVNVVAGDTFLIQIGGFAGATGNGTLEIQTFNPPPCLVADDWFEENDGCASAVALVDGAYPGLVSGELDSDFYRVQVAAGATLTVEILFDDDLTDVDLYLWDPSLPCGTDIAGVGPMNGSLAQSFSHDDDELVQWTNTTGAARAVVIEVDWFAPGVLPCNVYDMTIDGSGVQVGTAFCSAVPNSTGVVSELTATHAATLNDASLRFDVRPVPSQSFGFLLLSHGTTPATPAGGGVICLAPTVFRLVSSISNPGAGAYVSVPFPWGGLPAPILAGETRHFQYWHRDLAGGVPISNFSRGLSVTFL